MKNSPFISYQKPRFVDEAEGRIDIRAFRPHTNDRFLEFKAPDMLLGGQEACLMLALEWEASVDHAPGSFARIATGGVDIFTAGALISGAAGSALGCSIGAST